MLSKEKLRRADVVGSLLLIGMGTAVLAGALRMPRQGSYGGIVMEWYTSPAFFPLLLGVLLILCASGVLVRAMADGGHRHLAGEIRRILRSLPTSKIAHRIGAIWALLAGYILCLALHPFAWLSHFMEFRGGSSLTAVLVEPEGANYVVSSFLFLALFMFVFYLPGVATSKWKRAVAILSMSGLVAWGVAYLFTEYLYSPLPW